jgi:hypothetical protein
MNKLAKNIYEKFNTRFSGDFLDGFSLALYITCPMVWILALTIIIVR